jgi:SseB protein N-terminal domain
VADLSAGDERFRGDHGGADPVVATALAAYAAGTGGEHAALRALAGSRLLVPVVAVLATELAGADGTTGPGAHGRSGNSAAAGESAAAGGSAAAGEKASEMAMPKIIGRDGRQAMPAFTCLEAVQQWKPAARPVPVPASAVWQSAMQESCAVVIDIAGPVPIVVEGSRLAALAVGGAVPGMHEDPDVWQQVALAAAEVAPGIRVRLSQPNGGLDFTLELAPPAGSPGLVPEDVASRVADAVHDRLPGRIRAGIAVLRRPG